MISRLFAALSRVGDHWLAELIVTVGLFGIGYGLLLIGYGMGLQ